MPETTYTTANTYKIEEIGNDIIYDYCVDYNEIIMMSLAVLQNSKKKYEKKIEDLEKRIIQLEQGK